MDTNRSLRLGKIPLKLDSSGNNVYKLGVRMRCSVHLINEGVTQRRNENGEVVTVIEWGLSAPADVMESEVSFRCDLDGQTISNCELLVMHTMKNVHLKGNVLLKLAERDLCI